MKRRAGAGKIIVQIELQKDLVKTVQAILEARGTDLETYIRLQLRAFRTSKTLLTLAEKMPFGKYAGEKIEDICRADTGYMDWIVSNSTSARFDLDVLELLNALTSKVEKSVA